MIFQLDEDEEEKRANEIDVQKYKDLKRKGVYWWINHLRDQGIVSEKTTQLLHKARLKRNKVHTWNYVIPEQDRSLFSYVYAIMHPIFFAMTTEGLTQMVELMREKAERGAEYMLGKLEEQSGKS